MNSTTSDHGLGRVWLMDGAMGTLLSPRGSLDRDWNLDQPEGVAAIHRQYVAAGAEILVTNTFQAQAARSAQTVGAAVRLARSALGERGQVWLDIGPMAAEGVGHGWDAARFEQYLDQLVEPASGCEGVLLETWSNAAALSAARQAGRLGRPVWLSLWFRRVGDDYLSADGCSPSWFAQGAASAGVAGLGVNCGPEIGVRDCAAIVRDFRRFTGLPLLARPNAGTPRQEAGSWVYPRSPEAMAAELPELLEAGANLIGGCCGTTPAHIAAFREVIKAWNTRNGMATD